MKNTARMLFALALCLVISTASCAGQGAVVLALSGGGSKGLAHVGVLKVLSENHIPIAGIVGTSMGAIIGGLAATGYTPQELEDLLGKTDLASVALGTDNDADTLFKEEPLSPLMPKLDLNIHRKVIGPKGPLTGAGALNLFLRLTSRVSVVQFDELPIPFAAVATDLVTGEKVVLRHGSLASAMRASMSIPGLFEPWPVEGRLLVDGGLVSNLPVTTAKEIFPGYPIIAVDVSSMLRTSDEMRTMIDVIDQTITILTRQNVDREAALADLTIRPDVGMAPLLGDVDVQDIFRIGEIATRDNIAMIQNLAASAPPAPQRSTTALRVVSRVQVEGIPSRLARRIKNRFKEWVGRPVDPEAIVRGAEWIRTREDVRTVDYCLVKNDDGVDVVLKINREPAYRLALDGYATNLSNQSWLGIRGTFMDLASDGDYLNLDAIIGEDWAVRAAYHFAAEQGFYEVGLQSGRFSISPLNGRFSKWEFQNISLSRSFTMKRAQVSLGIMGSRTDGGGTVETWGPTVRLAWEGPKPHNDPSGCSSLYLGAWFPDDGEELLYRLDGKLNVTISPAWRVFLKGGFMEGNEDPRFAMQAAYLGGRGELYSLMDHPLRGERFAWWRVGMKYRLGSGNSPWSTELFGGQGYVWNDASTLTDDPWEVGLAFTIPSRLIKARLLAVYSEYNDWTFGFTVGEPRWSIHHPFP